MGSTEQIRDKGKARPLHVRKQQGRTLGCDHTAMDLGNLEIGRYGRFDNREITVSPQNFDEGSKIRKAELIH
jgi:hypothetical protein